MDGDGSRVAFARIIGPREQDGEGSAKVQQLPVLEVASRSPLLSLVMAWSRPDHRTPARYLSNLFLTVDIEKCPTGHLKNIKPYKDRASVLLTAPCVASTIVFAGTEQPVFVGIVFSVTF